MSKQEIESFPTGVASKLKTYVYRLIDPRNGETFYVGKGNGNRVFSHIHKKVEGDELDNKLKRIREIRRAGFEVAHVIHRHGLDDKTAFEVEAALIDAFPGLTNEVGGSGSNDYGVMHAKEIITRYSAEPAVFRHKALMINVDRTASERKYRDALGSSGARLPQRSGSSTWARAYLTSSARAELRIPSDTAGMSSENPTLRCSIPWGLRSCYSLRVSPLIATGV